MKKDIKIRISERVNERDLPAKPNEFIKYWEDKFSQIPDKYKENAIVDIETDTYYDGVQWSIEICYYRPETDDEELQREKREEEQAKNRERRELNELKMNKKKEA